ncbi:Dihydroxyacetone synthase [Tulasnella sp. JGI-2019a]|nr:Dihydroxyacetone synthase [Tulasnella sp. JGI-2019a]
MQLKCILTIVGALASLSSVVAPGPPPNTCPAGDFRSGSSCLPCQPGSYSSGPSSSTSCSATPAGNYDSGTGNTQPYPCPIGTYAETSGNPSCTACPSGYTTSSTGSTTIHKCKACDAGTKAVTDNTGSVTCSACPQGSWSSSGQTTCTSCPSGSTSPASATSSSQCTACSPGNKAVTDGSTGVVSCSACPKGSYQSLSGQTTCQSCPAGSTTAGTGTTSSTQCTPQPTGGLGRKKRSMSCLRGYKKCFQYSGIGGFECVDIANDPESCGGCVAPEGVLRATRTNDDDDEYEEATGEDCTAIPGASTTTCRRGQCVIEKCRKGFMKLRDARGKARCVRRFLDTQ